MASKFLIAACLVQIASAAIPKKVAEDAAREKAAAEAAKLAEVTAAMDERANQKLPLLRKLGELKVATTLSEAGLLSKAEKDKVFSSLEKAGAFSLAEKLLPLADSIGALKLLEDAINSKPGDIRATGVVLAALGPAYAALASQGLIPEIDAGGAEVLVPGLVFTLSTGAGIAFISLSNLVADLQGPPKKVGGALAIPPKTLPLLSLIEKKGVATGLAKAGLLSAAEKNKVFSSLEKNGLYSTVEKLLPIADNLGLLELLQANIDKPPGNLVTEGAILLVIGPILSLASLGAIGLAGGLKTGEVLPIPEGSYAWIPALITLLPGAVGVGAIGLGLAVESLQDTSNKFEVPEFVTDIVNPKPNLPAPPPKRAAAAKRPNTKVRALPQAQVRQYATALQSRFSPNMQRLAMPSLRRPFTQTSVLAETHANSMSFFAVVLIGLFAGSSITFGFYRSTPFRALLAQF